jgi:ATP-dependent Clp protease ATP-binding subunit ClpC
MSAPITDRTRFALALANRVALELGAAEVTPDHVLAALVQEGEGVAAAVLHNLRVDPIALEQALGTRPGNPPGGSPARRSPGDRPAVRSLPYAASTTRLLAAAEEEQKGLRHGYVGTEHLLLGLLRLEDVRATAVLEAHGVRHQSARKEVARPLGTPLE